MAVNINLFPPVLDVYMPAFLINSSDIQKNICRVYFSISAYNNLSEIKNIQVTVTNQNTNISVLNRTNYPCEIMLSEVKTDLTRDSDDKYYVEIKSSDIEGGFQINQYYKVQLRFTGADAANVDLTLPQAIDSWLTANLSNFSEWSTVCLVRGISTPTLSILGFDSTADTTLWSLNNVDLVGHLSFADSAETDTLKSYQIKLYNANNELLTDSGLLYTNNYTNINEFSYVFEYNLNEGDSYYFTFEYETANMYKESYRYDFIIIQESAEMLDAEMTAILDEINGCIGINIKDKMGVNTFVGNITIRRTSSESNFTIWEDIHTASFEDNSILDYTWWDFTIKSGVYYKYLAQKRTSVGNRGIPIYPNNNEPIMMLFDTMYLTGQGNQLNIRFDPKISSFKRNVSESKTDTIGSKYPFVKRNGYMDYKSFPISGLITHLMDPSHSITSKEKEFRDSLSYYEEFNKKNRIDDFNDWTYEREFREKVSDFLYANKVRLFRSATEGNILVRLMDINFTPNEILGRRIYTFTATAYEIDEFNIKNCDKYGINSLGTYDTQLQFNQDYIGQFNEIIPAGINVLELIEEKYKKYTKEGYVVNIDYLDFLRIEMEDKPYLINENADGPYVVNDRIRAREELTSAYLGYLVYINEQPIVINPEGIYELKGEDIKITSLRFPIDTKINIDYHTYISQKEDNTQLVKTNTFYKRVGQLWGGFAPNDSLYQQIWNKYFEKYSTYMQTLLSLDEIKVEAEPGTVVYVKESKDKDFQRHVIGETHTLDFYSEDCTINGLYFAGLHFEEANESEKEKDILPSNKFIDTGIILDKYVSDTSDLIENGVYTLADDYLEVLDHFEGAYSFKSKKQFPPDTASANQDNIEHSDINKAYTLLLDRVYESIDDDGGILVDHEFVEDVHGDYWTGELYVDGNFDENQINQIDANNSEDFIKSGDKVLKNGYTFKSKMQEPENDTASANSKQMEKSETTYTISLNKEYDEYYNLVVYKEIDKEYALLLQRLIDEANSRYLWHDNKWWLFTKDNDVLCSVEALIDYCCEIVKGRY